MGSDSPGRNRNAPRAKSLGRRNSDIGRKAPKNEKPVFSHPDYTVGIGISPIRPPMGGSQTCGPVHGPFTAGGESHPALKTLPL